MADSAAADVLPSRQALLGLSLRAGVLPAPLVRAATTVLRPLFLPLVIVGALAALVGVDVWLVLGDDTSEPWSRTGESGAVQGPRSVAYRVCCSPCQWLASP